MHLNFLSNFTLMIYFYPGGSLYYCSLQMGGFEVYDNVLLNIPLCFYCRKKSANLFHTDKAEAKSCLESSKVNVAYFY
jgi:hypothetical protein